MIETLKELNGKVNAFVDFVVKTACESTTSGNYFVSVDEALKASEMTYEDFLSYKSVIQNEIAARDEVLDLDFNEKEEEFDVNCALDYCPSYQWCDGDEEIFGCSYEEWLERPAKRVRQLGVNPELHAVALDLKRANYIDKMCEEDSEYQKLRETYEAALESDNYDTQDRCYAAMGEIRDKYAAEFDALPQQSEPDVYFTVRDGFGDDVEDKYIATFEEALKALKAFCAEHSDVAENAMLGMVCKAEDKIHRCVLVQTHINKYDRTVLNPMYENISEEALAVPQVELASLKAKQIAYPFDEQTQSRIDALEKRLGIFEREVKTTGDLYVGKWRVHIVGSGERYGANNNLTNDENRSLVEFWDMDVNRGNFPNGQFVSRYDVETLFEDKWGASPETLMEHGLCLDYDNRSYWTVSGDEMTKVFEWLKNRPYKEGEHFFEWHGEVDVPIWKMEVRFGSSVRSPKTAGEQILGEVMAKQPFAKDVLIEPVGSYKNGWGYSVSFACQANEEAVRSSFENAFEDMNYGFEFESKVSAAKEDKKSLESVIKGCEEMRKGNEASSEKALNTDREER